MGLKSIFKLKEKKAEVPDIYLGATLNKVEAPSGREFWSMLSGKYIKTAIENVEKGLEKVNGKLPLVSNSNNTQASSRRRSDKASGGRRYNLFSVIDWCVEMDD